MTAHSFFKQSSLYTLGNIANRLAGFLMIPLYTHYLSPADYGVIELVDLFLMFMVITFGLQSVGSAMTRIYHDYEDVDQRKKVISTALIGLAMLNVLVTVAGILSAASLSELIFGKIEYQHLIAVAFVAMFLSNMVEVILVYERIRQNAVFFVLFSLCYLIGSLTFNIYFIAFQNLGIWGFIWSKLIVAAVGALYLLARTLPLVGLKFDKTIGARMVSFGTPLILVGLAFFIIHFSNRFFLNSYASLADVGLFSLAYKFAILITILVGEPFGRVWSVSIYDYSKQDDWKENFGRILAYLVFFLVLVGLSISLFIEDVIRLMADESFLPAAALVPILVIAYIFRESGDYFRNILYINKRSGVMSRIAMLCALTNLALNYLLIEQFNLYGAAIATVVTWLAYILLCWSAQHREFGIKFPLKQFAFLGILACVIYAISIRFEPSTWYLRLGFHAGLVILFMLFAWVSNYFLSSEKQFIKKLLGNGLRHITGK